MRAERINSAVYFNMSQGDEDIGDDMESISSMGVTQTNESGVQANAQTSSSGVQATVRPKRTFEAGVQVEARTRTAETQATEDKSEEIEKSKRANEIEKQAFI